MSYRLLINDTAHTAQEEFEDAIFWYENEQTGLGDKFRNSVKAKLELIILYPERYPKRKGNFRETPVKVFPYNIVNTFYKKEGIITVS